MPIRISELSDAPAVERALAEFDREGRDAFLARYGYGRSRTYFVERDGRRYDSKAIAGVAFGKQYSDRPTPRPADFSGGEQSVARALRALGFRVIEAAPPASKISTESVNRALDEWDSLGRDEFLRKYDLIAARRYFIERDGNSYDAKAIVAVAWSAEHPGATPLASGDFSGNRQTIRIPLERLGLTIVDAATHGDVRDLEPGEVIRRRDLHDRYGGRHQGGIGPSATTPNVLIFSDPESESPWDVPIDVKCGVRGC